MLIRAETESDREAVHAVNLAAFEAPAEAELVNALREKTRSFVSLVAEEDGVVVGHIMFSPVTLADHPDLQVMGLAPMAVTPSLQRTGIGSALVGEGLERCRQAGAVAAIVLGHPDYYPRFGFVPASRFGIDSKYEVPDEVFMALELEPGALEGRSGRISYHSTFDDME